MRLRRLTVGGRGGANNPEGVGGKSGKIDNGDIVTIVNDLFAEPKPAKPQAERGNSRAYTLDRLEKERPDLYARVKADELSANKAAIEAGWRKPKTPLETALAAY